MTRQRRPTSPTPPPPNTLPTPTAPAKGSDMRIARCPLHGIAYDQEREECPECAKGPHAEPPASDRDAPSGA